MTLDRSVIKDLLIAVSLGSIFLGSTCYYTLFKESKTAYQLIRYEMSSGKSPDEAYHNPFTIPSTYSAR